MRKGCDGNPEIAILPQFLAIEPHFVRKSCAGRIEIAILPQFLAIEPHVVQKGSRDKRDNRNRNFTAVFGDRTSFRAKGLRFRAVSLALPRAFQERNRKEGESKRAKRARENVKV